jgi:glutamate-ammonia-ligase adenylyltransferase
LKHLRSALCDVLAGTPLAEPLAQRREALEASRLAEHDEPPPAAALPGIARLFAADADAARFASHRPALYARLCRETPESLRARVAEIREGRAFDPDLPLEDALDEMRVLRREETCAIAALDLAGRIDFEEASLHLSWLAEAIALRALALAKRGREEVPIVVLGMGKIAGREFTYHSDLDLIFLYAGSSELVASASRIGQRLIAYLTTMTGAGIAYPVDARLRPSGQQGMLVTSLDQFEAYQCEQAEIWEHVALLRGRAIGSEDAPGARVLARVHHAITSRQLRPWAYLADLRARVERERAGDECDALAIKTGRGGTMDLDFLASGAQLERGRSHAIPLPSVPALLRGACGGSRVDAVVAAYAFLRRIEARARQLAGRGIEALATLEPGLARVAELVEPGLSSKELVARQAEARAQLRRAWDDVTAADTIGALET